MNNILDSDGKIIQRSRNLRGIREYVAHNTVATIAIDYFHDGTGQLSILFDNRASYQVNFASFAVLQSFVRRWRNVYGSTLLVNGRASGVVSFDNSDLIAYKPK